MTLDAQNRPRYSPAIDAWQPRDFTGVPKGIRTPVTAVKVANSIHRMA
jgi:hypothetical protein